ncbi:MAG TPA: D-2-hydroxyacid dehydrogenase [Clostridia bacterium]|nr:D-2-hydroxyacid dehydrogenase [Clostridia bacterium]
MKIVILDGYTTNPGDLDWGSFASLGELTVYDRTAPGDIFERASDAEIILTNKTLITDTVMEGLPKARYIGLLSTGTNAVDLEAARKREIAVTNIPAYSTDSVAQLVFALLLELCMRTGLHDAAVHNGEWAGSVDFSFTKAPLIELSGKTMGIIGYGSIGRRVAAIADAMGMKVIASSRTPKTEERFADFRFTGLDELLEEADAVSLHCPLTQETKGLIGPEALKRMKRTAYLINTSRGPVLDEAAVAEALNTGRIAGAGLDVLSTEPPAPDNPLLTAKNCIITPHLAWATTEARARLIGIAAGNIRAFLNGKAINVVNAWYSK